VVEALGQARRRRQR